MNKGYYILLSILFIAFCYVNFLLFTIKFDVPESEIKVHKKEVNINPKILNFGDVIFDRGVRNIMENRGRDPFEYIKKKKDLISGFDITVANLEGPIVTMDRALCQQKAYNFQFASNTTSILQNVGINMVNIANNHAFDCYKQGFESTKNNLNKAGIPYMGDTDPEKSFVIKNIKGKNIAFIGIDEAVQPVPVEKYYPIVKKLKLENDFVVVNIHWGTEYALTENFAQTEIAHNLIDNGADVIFGHHPHVVEPVRVYKGKAIFFSLGNFVFDQDFGDTTVGLGAGVEFGKTKATFTLFPFNIKVFAPDFMEGTEKDKFCDKFLKDFSHTGCIFSL